MNILPSYMYQDPAKVLESKQEYMIKKSCAGCVHEIKLEIAGDIRNVCNKGKRHGRRCKLYAKN